MFMSSRTRCSVALRNCCSPNHESRSARLRCFYVGEMRAARYDQAQCDYNNRFADVIEIHRMALDGNS